jgi:hypothetical protein
MMTFSRRVLSALSVASILLTWIAGPGAATAQAQDLSASPEDPQDQHDLLNDPNHMFGVLPNYLTTTGKPGEQPLSVGQKFSTVARGTFDPIIYPVVGVISVTHLTYGGGFAGFSRQYAASFADNATGNFMTSAIFPSLFHQDPRYYTHPDGSRLTRVGYAASRVLIEYSDSGHRQLNMSELGGTFTAAAISNAYYPASERTAAATFERMGLQIMWDALSNELKEFWPDVKRKLHHTPPGK